MMNYAALPSGDWGFLFLRNSKYEIQYVKQINEKIKKIRKKRYTKIAEDQRSCKIFCENWKSEQVTEKMKSKVELTNIMEDT